jgi:hypothetical protein
LDFFNFRRAGLTHPSNQFTDVRSGISRYESISFEKRKNTPENGQPISNHLGGQSSRHPGPYVIQKIRIANFAQILGAEMWNQMIFDQASRKGLVQPVRGSRTYG